MEKKTESPDLKSKKQRIASLQESINKFSLDLFAKEPTANLYNYQYVGEFLKRLFEELSCELNMDEKKEAKKNWDSLREIIQMPVFNINFNDSINDKKGFAIPNNKNRKKIEEQLYNSRIFLIFLLDKYGLESLKQEKQDRKES